MALGRAGRRLEQAVRGSCRDSDPWPARVVAGVEAALRFADADPPAAHALTLHSAFRRLEGAAEFEQAVDRLAALLREGAPPTPHPERTSRVVVLRVARQMLLQLERRPDATALEIAPDLAVFALIPYLSYAEARRWAGGTGSASTP